MTRGSEATELPVALSERKCFQCGRPITKSDGGVLARDLLKALEMDIWPPPTGIRETCGHCVLKPGQEEYLEKL